PKPMLVVGGKPLIVWHIEKLAAAGFTDVAINTAWLGQRIVEGLGDGARWGLTIHYSHESTGLETAGGIAHARHLLGEEPFLAINGDVFCDWDPARAAAAAAQLLERDADIWLLMVDTPPQHANGDFAIDGEGWLRNAANDAQTATYAGIAVYRPSLFAELDPNAPAPLRPLFDRAIAARRALGSLHRGFWEDVGTPQRLDALDARLGGARHGLTQAV
ncbi:MAG: nucleotidyltransferase family protein, partial [Burkholderiaceae bacterium]|nr:nucleotidyltransferase family protein [Burkholderiaceae bacterium]